MTDDEEEQEDAAAQRARDELRRDFTSVVLTEPVKRQAIYLGPHDTEIAFDEDKHIYFVPELKKEFSMSVTGFCKKEIHKSDFNPVEQLQRIRQELDDDGEFDLRVVRAVEWKYAALFGSMFHAIVEYFFNRVVNGCGHPECRAQPYNEQAYSDYLLAETNNYRLASGLCGQASAPDPRFNTQPIMPCLQAVQAYNDFAALITDDDTFAAFLKNNQHYDINTAKYRAELKATLDKVCTQYEDTLDRVLKARFSVPNYLSELCAHLDRFRVVLQHLPLGQFCDIRPEYVVFSLKQGLAGSVDLTMRSRANPYLLYIYDWKTSRKIFRSFRRDGVEVNQLVDYSCQLHTYANLIRQRYDNYRVELFVVNVNNDVSCIYNVAPHFLCRCHDIFEGFRRSMLTLCTAYD